MDKETLRMQMLAGVITESEYAAAINQEVENTEKDSLNEHYVAGGIVGIGAITQIPSRAKADYEDAFEYFLSQKYSINEEMEKNEIVDFVEKNFDTIKDNFYKSEKEIIMDTDGDEIDLSNLEDQLSTATDAVSLIDVINERSIGGDLDNPEDAQILFDQIKSYASLGEGKEVEEPYNY